MKAKYSQANCAATIKKLLKAKWPGVKFSVTSRSFSGGDSVDVRWEDGPDYNTVDKMVRPYQYGSFNGMEDIYENSNSRDDIPQTKYLHCSRKVREEVEKYIAESVAKRFSRTVEEIIGSWDFSRYLGDISRSLDLTKEDWKTFIECWKF